MNSHDRKPLTRRDALTAMGASVALLATSSIARSRDTSFFKRHHLDLGVQLYSVGDLARQDMAGTLQALAAAGYRTTELAGYMGHTPQQLRRLHDDAGLSCSSAHVKFEDSSPQEPGLRGDLNLLAEQMHLIGVKQVIAPGFPVPADVRLTQRPGEGFAFNERVARALTQNHWNTRIATLNELGHRLHRLGLSAGYHNHSFEFLEHDGLSGMQMLLRGADRKLITFELDAGWAFAAGQDPIELLRAHPGRFGSIHVKDMTNKYVAGDASIPRSVEIGSGLMNWQALLNSAYASGARHFYVEQEPPFVKPPLQAMTQNAAYLLRDEL